MGEQPDVARDHVTLALNATRTHRCAGFCGSALLFGGEPAKHGIADDVLRLDPRGPLAAMVMQFIAISYYFERRLREGGGGGEAMPQRVTRIPLITVGSRRHWAAWRTDEARVALHRRSNCRRSYQSLCVLHRPPVAARRTRKCWMSSVRRAAVLATERISSLGRY